MLCSYTAQEEDYRGNCLAIKRQDHSCKNIFKISLKKLPEACLMHCRIHCTTQWCPDQEQMQWYIHELYVRAALGQQIHKEISLIFFTFTHISHVYCDLILSGVQSLLFLFLFYFIVKLFDPIIYAQLLQNIYCTVQSARQGSCESKDNRNILKLLRSKINDNVTSFAFIITK